MFIWKTIGANTLPSRRLDCRFLKRAIGLIVSLLMPSIAFAQPAFLDKSASLQERMLALSMTDRAYIQDIFDVLDSREYSSNLTAIQEKQLLNEVMNVLRRLSSPSEPLEWGFALLAMDEERSPGLREYAIQHLGAWAKRGEKSDWAVSILLELTHDPVVSTSAVLQLHHLRKQPMAIPTEFWPEILERSTSRQNLRDADKLTLLLVAKDQQWAPALSLARQWGKATADSQLFAVAVGTMAELGTEQDISILESWKGRPQAQYNEKVLAYAEQQLQKRKSASGEER